MSETAIIIIVVCAILALNGISLFCIHKFNKDFYDTIETKGERIFFHIWMMIVGLCIYPTMLIGKLLARLHKGEG